MNIFSEILFGTSIIILVCAVIAFKRKDAAGAPYFVLLMIAAFFYSAGYAFQLSSDNLKEISFWIKVQYIGIPFIPPFWLLFAVHFVGFGKWATFRRKAALFVIPFITFILVAFHEHNSLYYTSLSIVTELNTGTVHIETGTWYWVSQIYSNVLVLSGALFFLAMYYRAPAPYKKQAIASIIASFVPWAAYILYLLSFIPNSFDMTPFALSISGVIFLYALTRFNFLRLIPIAREKTFENMMGLVIVTDIMDRILDYNRSAGNSLSVLNEKSIGKSIDEIFNADSDLATLVKNLDANNSAIRQNIRIGERIFAGGLSIITGDKNEPAGKLIIMNDITDRIEALDKLEKYSEELKGVIADKDKFFSIIAHDLRGPFQGTLGLSGILATESEDLTKEEIKEIASNLNSALINQYNFLEELLQWAGLNTNRIVPHKTEINPVSDIRSVAEVLKANALAKNISVKLPEPEEIIIQADRDMFRLVVRNLLSNAVKFTRPEGVVTVSLVENNGYIVIAVKDTGVGISTDNIKKLFYTHTSFTTRGTDNEKGTGLGLILCREIIEKHSGKIWVESELGKGSTFVFTLPK